MEQFATMYEFMLYTKAWVYVLMGVTLLSLFGFYLFLTGRDQATGRPDDWDQKDL